MKRKLPDSSKIPGILEAMGLETKDPKFPGYRKLKLGGDYALIEEDSPTTRIEIDEAFAERQRWFDETRDKSQKKAFRDQKRLEEHEASRVEYDRRNRKLSDPLGRDSEAMTPEEIASSLKAYDEIMTRRKKYLGDEYE